MKIYKFIKFVDLRYDTHILNPIESILFGKTSKLQSVGNILEIFF